MKRFTGFLLLILIGLSVLAGDNVRSSRDRYIDDHKDDAIRDMLKSGVPASITLAQACLESQDGCSSLAKEANNHFGIKCSDWNGPSYIQDDDKKDECFRKYKTTLDSYDDHSTFLLTRPRYAFLFKLEKTDYKNWAKGLKKAGYATDPTYATRLIKIIEDNQLYLLDQANNDVHYTASIGTTTEDLAPALEVKETRKIFVPAVDAVDAFASRKVVTVNGVECVIARKGDTFHSLAQELQLGYWQLPKYNEMNEETPLTEGQIVYIKPKKSEGSQELYIVKPGDSVVSIAQENGVKSRYIYKYNDLPEGAKLEPGQHIYLTKSHSAKS